MLHSMFHIHLSRTVELVRERICHSLKPFLFRLQQKSASMQSAWALASSSQANIKEFGVLVGWGLSKRLVYILG